MNIPDPKYQIGQKVWTVNSYTTKVEERLIREALYNLRTSEWEYHDFEQLVEPVFDTLQGAQELADSNKKKCLEEQIVHANRAIENQKIRIEKINQELKLLRIL